LKRLGLSQKEGIQLANKSLYVGNMPYSASEDDIRELFEPFGPIGEIRVIGDKGFGFVDIPEENVAAAIEAINGKELGGRTLTVNEARPRTERSGGGRGRGGFGGGGGRRW
jgi:cold-inducible RNA-binding protein